MMVDIDILEEARKVFAIEIESLLELYCFGKRDPCLSGPGDPYRNG
jgi:hypothetical protein